MDDAKFFWWRGEDMAEFFEMGFAMAGSDFRVEFHPTEKMGLRIVPTGAALSSHGGEFNVVHTCPPDCPD